MPKNNKQSISSSSQIEQRRIWRPKQKAIEEGELGISLDSIRKIGSNYTGILKSLTRGDRGNFGLTSKENKQTINSLTDSLIISYFPNDDEEQSKIEESLTKFKYPNLTKIDIDIRSGRGQGNIGYHDDNDPFQAVVKFFFKSMESWSFPKLEALSIRSMINASNNDLLIKLVDNDVFSELKNMHFDSFPSIIFGENAFLSLEELSLKWSSNLISLAYSAENGTFPKLKKLSVEYNSREDFYQILKSLIKGLDITDDEEEMVIGFYDCGGCGEIEDLIKNGIEKYVDMRVETSYGQSIGEESAIISFNKKAAKEYLLATESRFATVPYECYKSQINQLKKVTKEKESEKLRADSLEEELTLLLPLS